ncbi:type B DNA-directed DNA polymerase [Halomarina salina]|uniref:DNA-directed DNA polymerase n=1 Tax=Halomarina salina TaxID=1872699 RepID=A0ABD5RRK7_9EURY|nr:type B DNA-directed DNA polymerase [Halomarina salina]
MPFTFDFLDGDVLAWSVDGDGVACERIEDYRPTMYVSAASHERADLDEIRGFVAEHPHVVDMAYERHRPGFRHDAEAVLRVDVDDVKSVTSVAHTVRGWGTPGEYRLFDVDLSREFRFCLERDVEPLPGGDVEPDDDSSRELRVCTIDVAATQLASDAITGLAVDGRDYTGDPQDVLDDLVAHLRESDPDVLDLNTARLVPRLSATAAAHDREDLFLGRRPGWQQLAGASTYTSYGEVGHSPARYSVPGRVIVDRSNTFLWNRSNLAGCLFVVEQSRKPLQELAWASIGNVLTAIQIREARRRNVLVPWNSWRCEFFKGARQHLDADRGGHTVEPEVGVHEDVHELDFSALYPNIMVTRNVSPETVCCGCHADREDVPGLGYSICDEQGYLTDVLGPLIERRDRAKGTLRASDDPRARAVAEGISSAIKWILVSCFGYQGFSNARYGRIEAHEAINAYAREILLDTKATLESHGWHVRHGIVDSLWVTADPDRSQTPLDDLCRLVSDDVGIRLEYEGRFDWLAFCPAASSDAPAAAGDAPDAGVDGALTKYFGRRSDETAAPDDAQYKFRGVECRQRSTPPYVADAQRTLVETFDRHRTPERVCDRLRGFLAEVRTEDVDPLDLRIENRVSKAAEEYTQRTRNVAALERAARLGMEKHPGEGVAYVVVDDDRRSCDRVRLAAERPDRYDASFYADLLVRAATSVVGPLGWREGDVRRYLADRVDGTVTAY